MKKFNWQLLTVLAVTLSMAILTLPAEANCQADLQSAMTELNTLKQKALNNPNQSDPNFDSNAYVNAKIKPTIDRMQQKQCISEMLQLMQYLQEEQSAYPAPR